MSRVLALGAIVLALVATACELPSGGLVDASGNTWVRYIDGTGGRLVSPDGRFIMVFPAGAVKKGRTLTVVERTTGESRIAGKLYEVSPAGLELYKAATVYLRFENTPEYLLPPELGQVSKGGTWSALADGDGSVQDGRLVHKGVLETAVFAARDACSGDDGCLDDLICEGGACVEPCRAPGDCGLAEVCSKGRCEPSCRDLCATNEDCSGGDVCRMDGLCTACFPTCNPVGEICDNGEDDDCDGKKDLEDDDCPPPPECTMDDDCSRPDVCVEEKCVRCRDNWECALEKGEVCTAENTCEFVEGCRSNEECPDDAGCALYLDEHGEPFTFCLACPEPESGYLCTSDIDCAGDGGICEHWGNGEGCKMCQAPECYRVFGCEPGEPGCCSGGDSCVNGRCVDESCVDADGDLFFAQPGCRTPVDCDDTNKFINPTEHERCNGKDDDCSGTPDDDTNQVMCSFRPGTECIDGNCR